MSSVDEPSVDGNRGDLAVDLAGDRNPSNRLALLPLCAADLEVEAVGEAGSETAVASEGEGEASVVEVEISVEEAVASEGAVVAGLMTDLEEGLAGLQVVGHQVAALEAVTEGTAIEAASGVAIVVGSEAIAVDLEAAIVVVGSEEAAVAIVAAALEEVSGMLFASSIYRKLTLLSADAEEELDTKEGLTKNGMVIVVDHLAAGSVADLREVGLGEVEDGEGMVVATSNATDRQTVMMTAIQNERGGIDVFFSLMPPLAWRFFPRGCQTNMVPFGESIKV
jgi:hypothetical protein